MKALGYLVTVAALVFVGASCIGEARASPPGVAEALTVGASAPALAVPLTSAPAFQFTCGVGALRIEGSAGQKYSAITVWNAACSAGTCTASATPVFLGGVYSLTGQVTAVTNSTGMPVCTSAGCNGVSATYEVKNLECIAGSSVVVTAQVVQ